MTTPPGVPQQEAAFFTSIRGWGLTRGDRGFLGGVVDGVSTRIGLATGVGRLIVVIAALILNGPVLLAYAVAWALLPDRKGNIIIQNFARGAPNVMALIGIALFTIAGFFGLDNGIGSQVLNLGDNDNGPLAVMIIIAALMMPVIVMTGLIIVILVLVRRGSNGGTGGAGSGPYAAMPGQTQAAAAPPAAPSHATPAASAAAPAEPAAAANTTVAPEQVPATSAASMPAPATQWTPPPAPAPRPVVYATPPRPRVPGPGRVFYLLALAWLALSTAAIAWAQREDQLAVPAGAAWLALWVTGTGVLMILISLSGRRLGFIGFVGVVAALPTLGLVAGADHLRDFDWDNGFFQLSLGSDHDRVVDGYDATGDFASEYEQVLINGSCVQEGADEADRPAAPASTERISVDSLAADTNEEIVAQVTYLTIPAGSNVTVQGVGDAQAHVIWPERDLTCHFWAAGGTHLELANPGEPTLTLTVRDDRYANTIIITEDAS